MPEYDGSIRINTKITTDNVIPEMRKLQGSLESVGKQAAEVQKRLSALNEAGVNKGAPEYRSEVKEIERLGESIGELIKRRRELLRQAEINWTGNTDITKDANWQEAFRLLQEAEEKMKAFQAANREYLTIPANPDAQSAVSSVSVAASQAAENLNTLKVNIEEYESALKELQGQGKFFGDEDYDRVYIALQNAKEAAKEYQAQLNSQTYKGQADEAARAAREAEKQAEAQRRIEAEAERNLQRENAKIQRQAEAEAKLEAQRAEEQRIIELKDNAIVRDQRIVELAERRRELLKEIKDLERAGVTSGYQDYDIRRQELSAIEQQIRDYGSRNYGTGAKKTKDAFWKVLSSVQKMSESAYKTIGKYFKKFVLAPFKLLKSTAKKSFSQVKKSAKSSNNIFKAGLKNILKYGLGIRSVYILVNKIRTAIKEGFSNYTNAFSDFKDSVNGLKASALTLKNAFASAFAPIVQIAIPYLQQLIVWMTRALNLFAQFTAALTGQNTYRRAVEQTTDAIEAQNKAQNKQLSGLDKLNNLTSDSGSGGKDTSDMFEEVPIDEHFKNLAEKTRDVMEKLFKPLKDAWNKEGKFVMDSWKYALDEIKKLAKDIGRDFLEVWQQDKTVAMFEDILHIIGDIGLVIGNLARNFRDAWNENKTGLKIFENIRDILAVIIHNIRLAADYTVEWADKINFQPLLTKIEEWTRSLIPVFDSLSGILTDFYTHVLLPLAKWTLEKGLPDLLQVFIDFNNKVDWEKLRSRLQEFWDHLEPFAEKVGEGLIIFIGDLADALADFVNSEAFEKFLKMVEDWMDNVDPEDVANGLKLICGAIIGFKAVSVATKGLLAAKNFLAIWGIGKGAAMAGEMTAAAGGVSGLTVALNGLLTSLTNIGLVLGAGWAGWKLGNWINEIITGEDVDMSVSEQIKEITDSFTDGTWKDAMNTWVDDTKWALDVLSTEYSVHSMTIQELLQNIDDGMIYTDERLKEIAKGAGLTSEDIEMLNLSMLSAHEELIQFTREYPQYADKSVAEINAAYQQYQDGTLKLTDSTKQTSNAISSEVDKMTSSTANSVDTLKNNLSEANAGIVENADQTQKSISETAENIATTTSETGEAITIDLTDRTDEWTTDIQDFEADTKTATSNIATSTQTDMSAVGDSISGVSPELEASKSAFEDWANRVGDFIKGLWEKAMSWFSDIANGISGIFNGGTGKSGSGASAGAASTYGARVARSYAVSTAMEKLSTIEIPAYANGQVIPRTMKQHLAWLGDNPRETEVVSPLSTIEKAVENVMSKYGNSGITRIEVPVYLNKNEIARAVWDETTRQFKRNGRLPYLT